MSLSHFNPSSWNINGSDQIFKFLSKDAEGSQLLTNINAVGTYAGGEVDFFIKPPAGKRFVLHRLIASVRDAGSFDSGNYGNGITLTNGIQVYLKKNAVETIITTVPIKTNPDWGNYCYDVNISNFGVGDEYMSIRWTFTKSGKPIVLEGNNGDEFGIRLHDDFDDLVHQLFHIQGISFNV